MKSFFHLFAPVLVSAALLVGCSTIPVGVVQSTVVAPAPLKLSIGYDLGLLRVDLHRGTHTVERFVHRPDAKGVMQVMPEAVKVENPYDYLVASFGNGLLVDYNGNLGIDLLRLYGLSRKASFDVVERISGLFPDGQRVAKNGPRLSWKGIGVAVGRLEAVTDGGIVHLHGEPFHPRMRIVHERDSISLEPAGRRNFSSTTIEQPSSNKVVFRKAYGNVIFRRLDANRIDSNGGLRIARVGNQVRIVLGSPGGIVASFVYYRTKNGCYVTSSDGYAFIRVSRVGDKIYVTNGRYLSATVLINSEQP